MRTTTASKPSARTWVAVTNCLTRSSVVAEVLRGIREEVDVFDEADDGRAELSGQVIDQRFQGSFALGRAGEQLPDFLHTEGGVQMADRVRCNGRQHEPHRMRMLRSRPEVALRIAQQAFEDDAEA